MPRGSKPFFTPEQDQDVAARYRAGETLRQIGAAYGVTWHPVQASLERQGIARRVRDDYRWKPTSENRAEVVRLWHSGLSVPKIARRVKTGNGTISRVLREAGIKPRLGGINRRFTDEQARDLAAEYQTGISLAELARRHDSNAVTVKNTLARIGIHVRDQRIWTLERQADAVRRYGEGESQQYIASLYGCSQKAVSNLLRLAGAASPRPPALRGPEHGSWRGGRTVDENGYVLVKVPPGEEWLAPESLKGYVREHRLVMARKLGRPLRPGENPHHKNTIRSDNSPENLELWLTSQPSGGRVADLIEWSLGLLDRYMPEALTPGWQSLPRPETIT